MDSEKNPEDYIFNLFNRLSNFINPNIIPKITIDGITGLDTNRDKYKNNKTNYFNYFKDLLNKGLNINSTPSYNTYGNNTYKILHTFLPAEIKLKILQEYLQKYAIKSLNSIISSDTLTKYFSSSQVIIYLFLSNTYNNKDTVASNIKIIQYMIEKNIINIDDFIYTLLIYFSTINSINYDENIYCERIFLNFLSDANYFKYIISNLINLKNIGIKESLIKKLLQFYDEKKIGIEILKKINEKLKNEKLKNKINEYEKNKNEIQKKIEQLKLKKEIEDRIEDLKITNYQINTKDSQFFISIKGTGKNVKFIENLNLTKIVTNKNLFEKYKEYLKNKEVFRTKTTNLIISIQNLNINNEKITEKVQKLTAISILFEKINYFPTEKEIENLNFIIETIDENFLPNIIYKIEKYANISQILDDIILQNEKNENINYQDFIENLKLELKLNIQNSENKINSYDEAIKLWNNMNEFKRMEMISYLKNKEFYFEVINSLIQNIFNIKENDIENLKNYILNEYLNTKSKIKSDYFETFVEKKENLTLNKIDESLLGISTELQDNKYSLNNILISYNFIINTFNDKNFLETIEKTTNANILKLKFKDQNQAKLIILSQFLKIKAQENKNNIILESIFDYLSNYIAKSIQNSKKLTYDEIITSLQNFVKIHLKNILINQNLINSKINESEFTNIQTIEDLNNKIFKKNMKIYEFMNLILQIKGLEKETNNDLISNLRNIYGENYASDKIINELIQVFSYNFYKNTDSIIQNKNENNSIKIFENNEISYSILETENVDYKIIFPNKIKKEIGHNLFYWFNLAQNGFVSSKNQQGIKPLGYDIFEIKQLSSEDRIYLKKDDNNLIAIKYETSKGNQTKIINDLKNTKTPDINIENTKIKFIIKEQNIKTENIFHKILKLNTFIKLLNALKLFDKIFDQQNILSQNFTSSSLSYIKYAS